MKTYRGIELKGKLIKLEKGKYNYCGHIIEKKRVPSSWRNAFKNEIIYGYQNQWILNRGLYDKLTECIEEVNEIITEEETKTN